MTTPLPEGFRITLDMDALRLDTDLWWGGRPTHILRFNDAGRQAWQELRSGPVRTADAGLLARRLTDIGFAHPVPPQSAGTSDVTVVVPVLNRPASLERCLTALGDRYPVVVVDDGSDDPDAISAAADRPGVTLLRHARNQGPAAARNSGLGCVRTDLVAFLDSDCVADPEWIDQLAAHFADPMVGAVAPRVLALRPDTGVRCGLDLGDRPARVRPHSRVSFLPTAALLVRRGALYDIATAGGVFDLGLRVGEDVDLVWRLDAAGWRVRYDPTARIAHDEPVHLRHLLARRFRYGTSAAQLAIRHQDSVPPLVTGLWSAGAVAAILARRPLAAAVALSECLWHNATVLDNAGAPPALAIRMTAVETFRTWQCFGRYASQFAGPALLLAAMVPGRRRWGRRLAIGSLLLGPAFTASVGDRETRLRSVPRVVADDVAYGAGVVAGCLRHRTVAPMVPKIIHRRSRRSRAVESTSQQGVFHGR
ncbi:mycofactocin biosynthesis glycosyltransferase MftF [Nocardia goodfellowii]